jgi:hypothetical protein
MPTEAPEARNARNGRREPQAFAWGGWENGSAVELDQGEGAALGLAELGLSALADVAEDRRVHGGDNVAESGLTVERLIERKRLVPRYGSGWQPS